MFLFPKPTGSCAVGTIACYVKDLNRVEPHIHDGQQSRELMLQIWYPASGELTAIAPYAVEPCAEMLHIEKKIPYEQLTELKTIRTYAQLNAAPDKAQKYPVILFSPGFICPRTNNIAQCEELASYGYIVVGIDPTYAASLVQFPDGRVVKHADIDVLQQDNDDREQQIWVDDALFVIDQLGQFNGDSNFLLHNLFDLDQIGIFGHSYGGSTAAQLCRLEKRCRAGVSLDGGLFGKNPVAQSNKPFMFILGEDWPWAHQTPHELHVTQEIYDLLERKWLTYIPEFCLANSNDTYSLAIKGTKHNDFSDAALIKEMPSFKSLSLDTGPINGFRLTTIVNAYLVNFFDKYLKYKPSALLDGRCKKFQEVEMLEPLKRAG